MVGLLCVSVGTVLEGQEVADYIAALPTVKDNSGSPFFVVGGCRREPPGLDPPVQIQYKTQNVSLVYMTCTWLAEDGFDVAGISERPL